MGSLNASLVEPIFMTTQSIERRTCPCGGEFFACPTAARQRTKCDDCLDAEKLVRDAKRRRDKTAARRVSDTAEPTN